MIKNSLGKSTDIREATGGPVSMVNAAQVYRIATIQAPGIGRWEISGQITGAYGAEQANL